MTKIQTGQYREKYLPALLLLLGVLSVYLPAVNGDFVFDDHEFVVRNPRLRQLEGLGQIWFDPKANLTYYPLTFTSFWIEYQIWQLWPTGYHLVNILLHASNAILLWRLLQQLRIPGAWVAAAIFALHPVQVESVAWISQRKNLLSGFFYLLTFLSYLRFTPFHLTTAQQIPQNWGYYKITLLCFLCALLSKTFTCSLPATLVLLIWWKRGKVSIEDILPLIPMFIMGAAASGVSAFLEWHPGVVGAAGREWQFTIIERILIAGRALWFYLATLIWPVNLSFVYVRWEIDPTIWWQYIFPITTIIVLLKFTIYQRYINRIPLIIALFFVGTLFPVLGFLDFYLMRYTFVADHFQYLPCIAIISGLVGWMWKKESHISLKDKRTQLVSLAFQRSSYKFLISITILVVLMCLTWQRATVYANGVALWKDTIEKSPGGWIAYNNLGWEYLRHHNMHEALSYLEKAVELGPREAKSHSNLSIALLQTGSIARALQHAVRAVEYESNSAEFISNLSMIYWRQGDLVRAVHYARLALQKPVFSAQVYYNIGLLALQDTPTPDAFSFTEAVSYIEKAVQLDSSSVPALHLIAWLQATTPEQAIRDGRKAMEYAEEACQRTGYRDPNLLDTLAAAYAESGQFERAIDAAQAAADLAKSSGQLKLEKQIRERLALYQERNPYYNTTQEKFSF